MSESKYTAADYKAGPIIKQDNLAGVRDVETTLS